MDTVYLVLGLILFIGLVVVHELGHAIAARRNGVEVEEFGIGFPPKLWGKKLKNGVLFTINLLPLGGFVRLKGEHDSATGPGTYGGASLWAKTKILLAGVTINWLTAALIFTVLAAVGLPKILPNQFTIASDTTETKHDVLVAKVQEDSPADKAGIKNEDKLLKINDVAIIDATTLTQTTKRFAGKEVTVHLEREGQHKQIKVALNKQRTSTQGYAGIQPAEQITLRSTWSAPVVGVGVTAQLTWETLKGLGKTVGQLFQREFAAAGQNVAGPVGIFSILQSSSEVGFTPVLFLIGIISLTLAVMNILPIPALDGGRLFVTLLFRILGKPLTKEREESIQAVGFLALMALVLLITFVDVSRIIKS